MKIYHLKSPDDTIQIEIFPCLLVADFRFRIFCEQVHLDGKHYRYHESPPLCSVLVILPSEYYPPMKIFTVREANEFQPYVLLNYS